MNINNRQDRSIGGIATNADHENLSRLPESLTVWQIRSLQNRYNLSDGHARDSLDEAEQSVLFDAGKLLGQAYTSLSQNATEKSFVETFMKCADEPLELSKVRHFFQYSASIGISIVGAALQALGASSVGVLHPSFDNIPLLLKRRKLQIVPLIESDIDCSIRLPENLGAVFLTIPNNPTGWIPELYVLADLAETCASRKIPLVIDATFRFQSTVGSALYETLRSTVGLEFIVIEDTGKTWPLNDAKASFLTVSEGPICDHVAELTEEILLNVSAPILETIRRVINCSISTTLKVGTTPLSRRRYLAQLNRKVLRNTLANHTIDIVGSQSSFVAWVPLPTQWDAVEFASLAEKMGVSILPGNAFLWNERPAGPYIRVALLRDASYFRNAMLLLDKALQSYNEGRGNNGTLVKKALL